MEDSIKNLLKQTQSELLKQGINPGAVDGIMGPLTYNALLTYQKRGARPTKPATIKKPFDLTIPDSLKTIKRGRGGGEPRAERGPQRMSLKTGLCKDVSLRLRTPMSIEALYPDPARLSGRLLPLLCKRQESQTVDVCCPSPAPGTHWRRGNVQPPF